MLVRFLNSATGVILTWIVVFAFLGALSFGGFALKVLILKWMLS